MLDALNIAQSGLLAANARVTAAAANIAGYSTDGPAHAAATLTPLADSQGVESTITVEPSEDGSDDLAGDLVDLQSASILYSANAAVVRTADQTLGTLLDVLDHDNRPESPRSY